MCKRLPIWLTALLLLVFASGCDSDRLTQFGDFAAAGTAYVTAFQLFTDEAGKAFIAADSATMLTAHNISADEIAAHSDQFTKTITAQDAQMTLYLLNLKKLNAHAALLGAYFNAITELTNGKAAKSTVTSVNSLVDALNELNPQIETVSFGGKSVKDLAGAVTQLVVAHFEVKALNEHLAHAGPAIDRALTLQEAAVQLIATQMQADTQASAEVEESQKIVHPYASNGVLPPSWIVDRNAFLERRAALASADRAKQAITDLHAAYRQLVADPKAQVNFAALLQSIGQFAGFVSAANAALSAPAK